MDLHLFEVALLIHAKETWELFFFRVVVGVVVEELRGGGGPQ